MDWKELIEKYGLEEARRRNSETCKKWYQTHKAQKREYGIKQRSRYRESWLKLVERGCVICGKTVKPNNKRSTFNKIHLHEKNGKRHPYYSYVFFALHAKGYDFVPLCYEHHRMIHCLIDFYKLNSTQKKKMMEIV